MAVAQASWDLQRRFCLRSVDTSMSLSLLGTCLEIVILNTQVRGQVLILFREPNQFTQREIYTSLISAKV